jgi:hypothetical protein
VSLVDCLYLSYTLWFSLTLISTLLWLAIGCLVVVRICRATQVILVPRLFSVLFLLPVSLMHLSTGAGIPGHPTRAWVGLGLEYLFLLLLWLSPDRFVCGMNAEAVKTALRTALKDLGEPFSEKENVFELSAHKAAVSVGANEIQFLPISRFYPWSRSHKLAKRILLRLKEDLAKPEINSVQALTVAAVLIAAVSWLWLNSPKFSF